MVSTLPLSDWVGQGGSLNKLMLLGLFECEWTDLTINGLTSLAIALQISPHTTAPLESFIHRHSSSLVHVNIRGGSWRHFSDALVLPVKRLSEAIISHDAVAHVHIGEIHLQRSSCLNGESVAWDCTHAFIALNAKTEEAITLVWHSIATEAPYLHYLDIEIILNDRIVKDPLVSRLAGYLIIPWTLIQHSVCA